MKRVVTCAVLALAVVLAQVMLVDRLPLPGGIVPDIVLVVVVAIGLTYGAVTGAITGFFAGLDLDLAPPGGHLIGESAFIFCLIGYACGWLGGWPERSAARLLAAAMIGLGVGEMLQATAGLLASDPGVTLTAVRHVLPVAVLDDILICPLVLFVALLASRRPAARQLTAWRARRAQPVRIGAVSGSELAPRWLRNDGGAVRNEVGRSAAITPADASPVLRRRLLRRRVLRRRVLRRRVLRKRVLRGRVLRGRVRMFQQMPRWRAGRSALTVVRTGRAGRPP